MRTRAPWRLVLPAWPAPTETVAARVLAQDGTVVAIVLQPAQVIDQAALRNAIVASVLATDVGATILAGVAFAPHLGGDAIGFT